MNLRMPGFCILAAISTLALSGCDSQPKTPAAISYEAALEKVKTRLPAETYFTNDFLKQANQRPAAIPAQPDKVRIGMPWILNDECALWFIAQEKGYFRDAGINAELVAGGPGKSSLALLAGGALEIAVSSGGSFVITLEASPTGTKVVAVATLLKDSAYGFIGLDAKVPKDQPSQEPLKPADLIDKRVGIQADGEPYAKFLFQKYRLPAERIRIIRVGFNTDPLTNDVVDTYSGWVQNQPRFLEQQGFRNWRILQFRDYGWNEHGDVSVVKKSLIESNPGLVTRYVYALNQSVHFYLDHPKEAAAITVQYGVDAKLTPELVLRRFELERDLVIGRDGQPPLFMSAEVWNNSAALLRQYGVLEL